MYAQNNVTSGPLAATKTHNIQPQQQQQDWNIHSANSASSLAQPSQRSYSRAPTPSAGKRDEAVVHHANSNAPTVQLCSGATPATHCCASMEGEKRGSSTEGAWSFWRLNLYKFHLYVKLGNCTETKTQRISSIDELAEAHLWKPLRTSWWGWERHFVFSDTEELKKTWREMKELRKPA